MSDEPEPMPTGRPFTFLTNHGHVLLALHRNSRLRQREIADLVGITEGATQRILGELHECGYLDIERVGRRNRYRVHPGQSMRHPLEHGHCIGEVLDALAPLDDRPLVPRDEHTDAA